MTKHKKSKYICDKIQKDQIQIWQNAKRQITNVTKCNNTKYKYDKTQKDKTQKWQNTKKTK